MRPRRSPDRAWHHPLKRVWCISIRSWLLLRSSQLRIRRLRAGQGRHSAALEVGDLCRVVFPKRCLVSRETVHSPYAQKASHYSRWPLAGTSHLSTSRVLPPRHQGELSSFRHHLPERLTRSATHHLRSEDRPLVAYRRYRLRRESAHWTSSSA